MMTAKCVGKTKGKGKGKVAVVSTMIGSLHSHLLG